MIIAETDLHAKNAGRGNGYLHDSLIHGNEVIITKKKQAAHERNHTHQLHDTWVCADHRGLYCTHRYMCSTYEDLSQSFTYILKCFAYNPRARGT